MKTRGLIALLIATGVFVLHRTETANAGPQSDNPTNRRFEARLISPRAGDVLYPGQQVLIRWETMLPGVDLTWCEVELYLSLDGGRTNAFRITPQLDPQIGYYNWTVPNIPTTSAVLDIHFGCEGYFPESPSPQTKAAFSIISSTGVVPEVVLNLLGGEQVSPGSPVLIFWNSSVRDVTNFELQVSYDRGAHFHKLAETRESQYLWNVPNNFAGHATFRVVAHTSGGGHFESLVSAEPQVLVRAGAR